MVVRMAVAMSLVAFAVCLLVGGFEAGNPFDVTVKRALLAMAGTLVIGLVVGTVFQVILQENLKKEEQRLKGTAAAASPSETSNNEGKTAT